MMHDFDPCVITELHCKKRDRLKPTSSFDGKKAVDLQFVWISHNVNYEFIILAVRAFF